TAARGPESGSGELRSGAPRQTARAGENRDGAGVQDRVALPEGVLAGSGIPERAARAVRRLERGADLSPRARRRGADVVDVAPAAIAAAHRICGRSPRR